MLEDTSSKVLTNLAAASMIQSMKGDLPGALISLAVIRNAEDANAVNSFGGYLRAIDSIKTSLPVLQYAYKLAPDNPSIISQLGHTYLDLGNVSKAETLYTKALGFDNDNPFALQGMVALYLKKGDKGKALEYMLRSSKFIFSVRTPLVYEQFRDYIDTKTSVEEGEGDREFAESLLQGTKTESIRVISPQIPKIPPFPFFNNLKEYEKSSVQIELMQLLGEITAKEQSLMAEMASVNMSDSHEPVIPQELLPYLMSRGYSCLTKLWILQKRFQLSTQTGNTKRIWVTWRSSTELCFLMGKNLEILRERQPIARQKPVQ